MKYSEEQIAALRERVKSRLSEKRFSHTLGVERAAKRLGEALLPDQVSELRVAALLHDIAKELPKEEQRSLLDVSPVALLPSDRLCASIHHSFVAPAVVLRDFPEYATEDILSAVGNHAAGTPDFSLFDEIVFVSDYVEDSRPYESCQRIAKALFDGLSEKSSEERERHLHKITVATIDETIKSILSRGAFLGERIVMTRNSMIMKLTAEQNQGEKNAKIGSE